MDFCRSMYDLNGTGLRGSLGQVDMLVVFDWEKVAMCVMYGTVQTEARCTENKAVKTFFI